MAPGQNVTLRGDVGGFDVGSEFSWQVIATHDFQLCVTERYTIDGYLGYRALSVDYSEGSGAKSLRVRRCAAWARYGRDCAFLTNPISIVLRLR